MQLKSKILSILIFAFVSSCNMEESNFCFFISGSRDNKVDFSCNKVIIDSVGSVYSYKYDYLNTILKSFTVDYSTKKAYLNSNKDLLSAKFDFTDSIIVNYTNKKIIVYKFLKHSLSDDDNEIYYLVKEIGVIKFTSDTWRKSTTLYKTSNTSIDSLLLSLNESIVFSKLYSSVGN